MRLYGDLQVGLSFRDRWARGHLFLPHLLMGAPPSRTNPDGQPWGYPVFDPRRYAPRYVGDLEGTVSLGVTPFVRARITKMFEEFDGVRIDHPHGLVCPWVYDGRAEDPMRAVREGARLFETPAPYDHLGGLAELAIARPDQIDPGVAPYDDERVRDLDGGQIDEYARFFDMVMEEARSAGRSTDDVLCEVLSTCPRPLACVMSRHGLGRFRVTQKASLADPRDGYRGENAQPNDWTMIGNHDTRPLLRVIDRWRDEGKLAARAAYLATRLEPEPGARSAFAARLLAAPGELVNAMFAELFVGPAENVIVFWSDLFGEREVYNTPGLVSPDNWTMRLPRAFAAMHRERAAAGEALDIAAALEVALRARGLGDTDLSRALAAQAIYRHG
jgi:4-alpha-glucanotransferase